MMIGLVAAICAGLAGWRVWRPPARTHRLTLAADDVPARSLAALGAAAVVLLALGSLVVGGVGLLLQVATAAVIGVIIWWVWRGRQADRAAGRRREEVAEAAQVLAHSLISGAVPALALAEAARESAVLAPAAAAQRIGADPVRVMFDGSRAAGAAGLAELARAWALIEQSGVAGAPLLQRVAQTAASEEKLAGEIQTELTASRATGRLLAGLPLAGVAVGFFVGGDPLAFLFGTLPGQVCLLLGVILAGAGVIWTERLAASTEVEVQLPQEYDR